MPQTVVRSQYGLPAPRAGNGFARPQAATDLADRAALQTDPGKDESHDPRVFFVDLVAGASAPFVLADVAVTVRRAAQDIDRTGPRRMTLAAAAPFQDLGTLVFGHHALHLQQEIFFRRFTDRSVEKDPLRRSKHAAIRRAAGLLQGISCAPDADRASGRTQPIQGSGCCLFARSHVSSAAGRRSVLPL